MLARLRKITFKQTYDDLYNNESNTSILPTIYGVTLKFNKKDSSNPLRINYIIDNKAIQYNGLLIGRQSTKNNDQFSDLFISEYKFTSLHEFTKFITFMLDNIEINIVIDINLTINPENHEVGFTNIPKNIRINKARKIYELQIINTFTDKISKYTNISYKRYCNIIKNTDKKCAFLKLCIKIN